MRRAARLLALVFGKDFVPDVTRRGRKPHAEPILQFFEYAHLPPHLQEVSAHFHSMALYIVGGLPRNPERTVALRKLLEAKDAAVRARLFKDAP
jgi:hypothetical protein